MRRRETYKTNTIYLDNSPSNRTSFFDSPSGQEAHHGIAKPRGSPGLEEEPYKHKGGCRVQVSVASKWLMSKSLLLFLQRPDDFQDQPQHCHGRCHARGYLPSLTHSIPYQQGLRYQQVVKRSTIKGKCCTPVLAPILAGPTCFVDAVLQWIASTRCWVRMAPAHQVNPTSKTSIRMICPPVCSRVRVHTMSEAVSQTTITMFTSVSYPSR